MKYKAYSQELWDQINKTLEIVLQQDSSPVAAFDADGTLWDTDLGESFFDYLIDNKLVELPPTPWEHYEALKKDPAGPEKAYLWLAQILKGNSLAQVQTWASESVQKLDPLPYFPEQKKLIDLFLSKKVQVYIVTASVKWAVEPGAQLIGVPTSRVIGIETEIDNGRLSEQQKGIISYRAGKSKALLSATNGKQPFFSAGNTFGDLNLLEMATHLRLAVSATHPDERLFRSELELITEAKKRGWPHHRFV